MTTSSFGRRGVRRATEGGGVGCAGLSVLIHAPHGG